MATDNLTLPSIITEPPKGYTPFNQESHDLMNLAAWHYQRIGQMGYLAVPPEGSLSQPIGAPANPAAVSRRVWTEEPPGSTPFDEQAALALPPGAGLGIDVPVLDFFVPKGFDGVIKWVSNNVLNPSAPFVPGSGTLIWKLLINGRPVPNFSNITVEKGTEFQGREESPIRIFSGDRIQYTVQQATGSTLTGTTVVSATGYYFPSKGIS